MLPAKQVAIHGPSKMVMGKRIRFRQTKFDEIDLCRVTYTPKENMYPKFLWNRGLKVRWTKSITQSLATLRVVTDLRPPFGFKNMVGCLSDFIFAFVYKRIESLLRSVVFASSQRKFLQLLHLVQKVRLLLQKSLVHGAFKLIRKFRNPRLRRVSKVPPPKVEETLPKVEVPIEFTPLSQIPDVLHEQPDISLNTNQSDDSEPLRDEDSNDLFVRTYYPGLPWGEFPIGPDWDEFRGMVPPEAVASVIRACSPLGQQYFDDEPMDSDSY